MAIALEYLGDLNSQRTSEKRVVQFFEAAPESPEP